MLIEANDFFQLGPHFLACGDARDPEIVRRLINSNKISLIVSDMPYAVRYEEDKFGANKNRKTRLMVNDHFQTDKEYQKFTYSWLELVKPYLTSKNSFYLFNSDKMLFAMREGIVDAGFKFAQLLVWVKNQSVLGRMDYLIQHELIAYGWYGTHKFQKSKDKSVLLYPKPHKSPLHPTMKPVGLIRRLILNSSRVADWIYDPFVGSGTTLVACEQTKRKCLAIEIDPKYCMTVINRFEKVSGVKAEKIT
jgi:DNA modification methylase